MRDSHWPEGNSDPEAVDEFLHDSHLRAAPPVEDSIAPVDDIAEPAPDRRVRRGLGRAFLIIGGAAVLFVLLYTADLLVSMGDVPRGVTVAGVDIGGLRQADAVAKLHRELEPRLADPVVVRAGDVDAVLDPARAGLDADLPATVERAGGQPLNPITRFLSFFRPHELAVVTAVDDDRLRGAIRALAAQQIDRKVADGGIGFQQLDGGAVQPIAIEPLAGQRLSDLDRAVSIVKRDWPRAEFLRLPVEVTAPNATSQEVHTTLEETVVPMVSGPIQVHGQGRDAVLLPADISRALRFSPEDGKLRATVDTEALRQALEPNLKETEQSARNSRIVFEDGVRTVEPAQPERRVDWDRTLEPVADVARKSVGRELTVAYGDGS